MKKFNDIEKIKSDLVNGKITKEEAHQKALKLKDNHNKMEKLRLTLKSAIELGTITWSEAQKHWDSNGGYHNVSLKELN